MGACTDNCFLFLDGLLLVLAVVDLLEEGVQAARLISHLSLHGWGNFLASW